MKFLDFIFLPTDQRQNAAKPFFGDIDAMGLHFLQQMFDKKTFKKALLGALGTPSGHRPQGSTDIDTVNFLLLPSGPAAGEACRYDSTVEQF